MSETIDGNTIRKALLEAMKEHSISSSMEPGSILRTKVGCLGRQHGIDFEQTVLSLFYDLFQNGHLVVC